jgi:hypothetical protein
MFWDKVLRYIGLPLAEKLVALIISFIKKEIKRYNDRKERKEKEKANKLKAKKYEEANTPDSANDAYNKLP